MALNLDPPPSNACERPPDAALERVPAALVELTGSFVVVDANAVCSQLLARPRERIVGADWMGFVEPADRAGLAETLSAGDPESVSSTTFRIMLPDGSRRWWSCGLRPTGDDETRRFSMAGHDCTQRFLELAQRDRERRVMSLAGLATGIAHELNQPLHAMRLAVQNVIRHLRGTTIDRKFLIGKFERIDRLIGRTAQLAEDVRQIGRYAPEQTAIADLHSAVEEAIGLAQTGAVGPKAKVRLRKPVQCRPVQINADRLEQAIILLLLAIAWRSAPADQWHRSDKSSLIDIEIDDIPGTETVTLRMIDCGDIEGRADVSRATSLFALTRGLVQGMGASLQSEGQVVEIVMPVREQEGDS